MKRKPKAKTNIVIASLAMILAASLRLTAISTGTVQASSIQDIPNTGEEPPILSDPVGRGDGMLERALRRELKINRVSLHITQKSGRNRDPSRGSHMPKGRPTIGMCPYWKMSLRN